ncbi:MAG: hypothetical protein JWM71_981 [Solirubrobacteraceae bacterium]|nr:hypothetical protein [Solirubrobacteraceae bacterium]
MGSHVASGRRLAPPLILAAALLAGCSSERLSQRTHYPAATVTTPPTVAVPATPVVAAVAPRSAPKEPKPAAPAAA